MPVEDAREEVGPRQRTGVGVRHVYLHLRQHDKHRRHERQPRREEYLEAVHELLYRLDGLACPHTAYLRDQLERQERPADLLQRPQHDPTRPSRQHRRPPPEAVPLRLLRHEAQVVRLLPDLGDQGERDAGGDPEGEHVEPGAGPLFPSVARPGRERAGVLQGDGDERERYEHEPQRLRPHLELCQQRHPKDYQRYDHERGDYVGDPDRYPGKQRDRLTHNDCFEREEDERETRVDERGYGRAQVPEPRPTREQVHVYVVAGRVVGYRDAGQEDGSRREQDPPQRAREPVRHHQRTPDGEVDEVRYAAQSRRCHGVLAPRPERPRSVPERVVFHDIALGEALQAAALLPSLLLTDHPRPLQTVYLPHALMCVPMRQV